MTNLATRKDVVRATEIIGSGIEGLSGQIKDSTDSVLSALASKKPELSASGSKLTWSTVFGSAVILVALIAVVVLGFMVYKTPATAAPVQVVLPMSTTVLDRAIEQEMSRTWKLKEKKQEEKIEKLEEKEKKEKQEEKKAEADQKSAPAKSSALPATSEKKADEPSLAATPPAEIRPRVEIVPIPSLPTQRPWIEERAQVVVDREPQPWYPTHYVTTTPTPMFGFVAGASAGATIRIGGGGHTVVRSRTPVVVCDDGPGYRFPHWAKGFSVAQYKPANAFGGYTGNGYAGGNQGRQNGDGGQRQNGDGGHSRQSGGGNRQQVSRR